MVNAAPAIPLRSTRRAATEGSGRALAQFGHSYTPRWPRYAAEYAYAVPQRRQCFASEACSIRSSA